MIIRIFTVILSIAALFPAIAPAASESRQDQLQTRLLTELNPEPFGPEYTDALKRGDRAAALRLVAAHYRQRPANAYLVKLAAQKYDAERARRAVLGDVTIVNIPHRFPDGRIDFLFDATAANPPRNNEWLWQLNRMWFWNDMAAAYRQTGDESNAVAFQNQVRDWILNVPPPPPGDNGDRPGSAWRSIETGIRLSRPWPEAFEVFRKSPEVSDETLLMMIASMHEQARHLFNYGSATRPNRFMGNWIAMEMNGVYTFASLFPEFRDAADMRNEAAKIITDALRRQLLPDGLQNELSPDYHSVVFNNNMAILQIARQYGCTAELPEDFLPLLEKAASATLEMATPRLTQPRTNDCYTISTDRVLLPASRLFPDRNDFRWAATGRAEGTPPAGETASRFLPWGGFAVMRSDWGPDAAYLCFDVGPLGEAHQHQDKLNINLYKGDDELIYDDGGGQYEQSDFYTYARTSAAHNTVTVDGMSQNRQEPRTVSAPIDADWVSNPRFDYARGVYDDGFGPTRQKPAEHRREVLFVKPDFFCVLDTLKSRDGKAHDYELLFQLDTLKLDPIADLPGARRSEFNRKYDIVIVPLLPEEEKVTQVSGQTTPRISGWYNGRNEMNRHPATTLSMTAEKKNDFRFATLLFPIPRGGEAPKVKRLSPTRYTVTGNGKTVELDLDRLAAGPTN